MASTPLPLNADTARALAMVASYDLATRPRRRRWRGLPPGYRLTTEDPGHGAGKYTQLVLWFGGIRLESHYIDVYGLQPLVRRLVRAARAHARYGVDRPPAPDARLARIADDLERMARNTATAADRLVPGSAYTPELRGEALGLRTAAQYVRDAR